MINDILWLMEACLLGFSISAVFAGILHLRRSVFLVPYVLLVGLFLYGYVRWENLLLVGLTKQNWIWGVVVAALVGILLIRNVLSQPATPRSGGPKLLFELFWFGLVYGAIDGLFLSVFPILLTWHAFPELGVSLLGKVSLGCLAMIASELIAIAYHAGYPEFCSSKIRFPIIGNGIISLAYLVSLNPISAFMSHAAMHIAAVWHGSEGTIQLPTHYRNNLEKQVA